MDNNKTKYRIIIGVLLFVCILLSIFYVLQLKELPKINKINEEISKELEEKSLIDGISAVDNIYIYGIHLNLSGKINRIDNINNLELILYDNKEINSYELKYEEKDNIISYTLSDSINEGICLDDLNIGNYKLLLKITTDSNYMYYSLYNTTAYSYMDYYTITRNGSNNYIEISNILSALNIKVTKKELPDSIYDIVVDPGHGGIDTGATKNNVYESIINLEVALKLKKELESLGLKVKLTREGNYNPGNLPGISPYGEHGRVNIGYEAKAKFFLSIHSNSLETYPKMSGVEVYTSSKNNKILASEIASNIVNNVGIMYSKKAEDKVMDGVYVRNFTLLELENYKKTAKKEGYTFYESATTSTQHYYVIRETGGIITNAYVDGRNTKKEVNIYRNSNIGLDGYLIELGYMTNSNDLKLLLDKKSEYAYSIAYALKKYLNITN